MANRVRLLHALTIDTPNGLLDVYGRGHCADECQRSDREAGIASWPASMLACCDRQEWYLVEIEGVGDTSDES